MLLQQCSWEHPRAQNTSLGTESVLSRRSGTLPSSGAWTVRYHAARVSWLLPALLSGGWARPGAPGLCCPRFWGEGRLRVGKGCQSSANIHDLKKEPRKKISHSP